MDEQVSRSSGPQFIEKRDVNKMMTAIFNLETKLYCNLKLKNNHRQCLVLVLVF